MTSLPTGNVTFVFTDIEGSTRLWGEHSDLMTLALVRHDGLLHQAIESAAGVVIKSRGEGDSFFAVFASPRQALVAANNAQAAIALEPWPDETPIRVRIAIHTGEAEVRDGDYYGPPVNRCARLRAIAHGGQTLLSRATFEAVEGVAPAGASFRDLGEHRLRDLSRPEQVFQLTTPGTPSDFPALKSIGSQATTLPLQLTSFVGREREVAEVLGLLEQSRIVTLWGSGGTGKTRLAIQAAAEGLDRFVDGVWFVELAPLTDAPQIPLAIGGVIGVREETGRTLELAIGDFFKAKLCLLILDNCEHLISACARLVDQLLHVAPGLRILTTSREALAISGEVTLRVPSLSFPETSNTNASELIRSESAVLFLDRASAANPRFALSELNAPAIARICRRLDGIPLAIELAAARVKAVNVEQIAMRLDDRFSLLTGGSRTALPRQQTLRATIDWSHDLLPNEDQVVLRRLSVFAGGFTMEAAEAVCADLPLEPGAVFDGLCNLVERSLVNFEESSNGPRYSLLESIRQYAREKLLDSGEMARSRSAHGEWFLRLAEEAEPHLRAREQIEWLDRLATEQDNIRSALEWSIADDNGAERGLRLANAFSRFWLMRGDRREGIEWLRRLIARPEHGHERLRAMAACDASNMASLAGQGQLALELSAYALTEGAAVQEPWFRVLALSRRALILVAWDGPERAAEARSLLEEAEILATGVGDDWLIGVFSFYPAFVELRLGNIESGVRQMAEVLAAHRRTGDRFYIGFCLTMLAWQARLARNYEEATDLWGESLTVAKELGERYTAANAALNLAFLMVHRGDYDAARRLLKEARELSGPLGDERPRVECLAFSGILAVTAGGALLGVQLMAAYETLAANIGFGLDPIDQRDFDEARTLAETGLGHRGFQAEWDAGVKLSLDQALALAETV